MKRIFLLTILIISIIATLSIVSFANEDALKGAEGDADAAIEALPKIVPQYNGENVSYIKGYEDNTFRPDSNMTKAEASEIFARLIKASGDTQNAAGTRFTDVVEGEWYYDAISYLDTLGFYASYESNEYFPNSLITRGEFVELAYLASSLDVKKGVSFKDITTEHKYYNAITAAADAGLINGYWDKTFRPDAPITRAEVVTIINRLLVIIANDRTMAKESLINTFSDIEGHWAEKEILMSANDNVKTLSHAKTQENVFKETKNEISFENKHIRVVLNKENAKISKIIYLPKNKNVFEVTSTPWLSYAETFSGVILEPVSLELKNNRLKFTYKDGTVAYFIIEVFDNYFTIELDSNLPNTVESVTFGRIDFDYTYSDKPDSYRASGVVMDTRTSTAQDTRPGGAATYITFATRSDLGVDTIGAKVGITFSTAEEHREYLKEIVDAIDPNFGIASKLGGPYTYDSPAIFEDYAIVNPTTLSTPENVRATAEAMARFSIGQADLHYGTRFLTIEPKKFKEEIADVFHENGVLIGLHTYASCLSYDALEYLSNPKCQQQLAYNQNTYTLKETITKFKRNLKTVESTAPFNQGGSNTTYILIDEEIIMVGKASENGFDNLIRGMFGTKVAVHEAGAEIRQLQGKYTSFQPIPGSELFRFFAEETARIYNEGDFDMIYLDAFESLQGVINVETAYYHYAEFYRIILQNCIKTPIIEDSASPYTIWAGRGRGGATDAVTKALKERQLSITRSNAEMEKMYYTATIGWINYDIDENERYKNLINKTVFHDDLDAIGSLALAYNFSTADNIFNLTTINAPTRHADNLLYYSVYSRLRKGGYFSPEVKEEIRNGKYEYKVFEKADGEWAFKEMLYHSNKVYDLSEGLNVTGKANNPFNEQSPFIRIECAYSTLGGSESTILELDENAELADLLGRKSINTVNLGAKNALRVKVLGNGSETGGICISISSGGGGHSPHTDYYVTTSHTGWKDFILVEANNGDHPGENFPEMNETGYAYNALGQNPNRSSINSVYILAHGDVSGVKIDDVRACTMALSPCKNPSVTIGDNTITFNAEFTSGEFIEYYPETNKAYLNYYTEILNDKNQWTGSEAHTKEITFEGSVTVPKGDFEYTFNAEPLSDAPVRAKVKIGLSGKIIENPDNWVAPEIDMKESNLNIAIK